MKLIKYCTLLLVIMLGSIQLSAQNMDTIVVKGKYWYPYYGTFDAYLVSNDCNGHVNNNSYGINISMDSLTGQFQDTIIVPDSLSTGIVRIHGGSRAYDLSKSYNEVVFDADSVGFWPYNPMVFSRGLNTVFDFSNRLGNTQNYDFVWDFGDGNTDTTNDTGYVIHNYANPGRYFISISFTDSLGKKYTNDTFVCIDSNTNPCTSSINYYFDNYNKRKIFLMGSHNFAHYFRKFIKIDWDYGDSTTQSVNYFKTVHTYAKDGIYQVCASYRDSLGCSYIVCDSISICALSFASNDPISVTNNLKTFTFSVGLQDSSNVTYEWDFGDGSTVNTSQNPTHTYTGDSIYIVKVTVSSSTGCKIQTTKTIDLSGCSFTASYTYSNHPTYNYIKRFTPVIDSGLYSIRWYVNNTYYGQGSVFNFNHVNIPTGYYEVCMKVTKGYCSKEYCDSIYICGITNYYYSNQVGSDSIWARGFAYGIDSLNMSQYTFKWYVNGVQKQSGSSSNFGYKFINSGVYDICFEVNPKDSGCSQTHCRTYSHCASYPRFSQQKIEVDSYNFSIDTPSVGYTYTWTINGTSVSTGNTLNYKFTNDGNYEVCAKVSPQDSTCPEKECKTFKICRAGLLLFSINEHKEDSMTFSVDDPHSAYTYTWTSNGSVIGTGTSLDYKFTSNGSFQICVNINSDSVCRTSTCQSIYVCNINSNYTITPGPSGSRNFNAITQNTNYTYKWIFGDGQTDTISGSSVNHTYSQSGQYLTKLIIYDHSAGCIDTTTRWLNYNHPNGLCIRGDIILDSLSSTWLVDSAVVYLIEHDTSAGTLIAIDSTYVYTADSNHYEFCGLQQGKYLIKAALLPGDPSYSNNIPTYYWKSTQWSGASEIVAWHTWGGIHIRMLGGTNLGGPGFIGGLISAGANKTNNLDDLILTVLLLDENGNTIDYRQLDGNYEYSFNVLYGTYKVVVDIPGRTTVAYTVTLDANNPTADDIDFTVNSTNVVLTAKDIPFTLTNNVYPNPANDLLNVDLNINDRQDITLEVLDMQGRVITTSTYNGIYGNKKLAISTAEVTNGIYMLRINAENFSITKKIIISK